MSYLMSGSGDDDRAADRVRAVFVGEIELAN